MDNRNLGEYGYHKCRTKLIRIWWTKFFGAPYGQWYFSTSNGWYWFHSSSSYAIIPKADLPLNKWIHLALVRNGDVLTHYLNGVAKASSAYTRTDGFK